MPDPAQIRTAYDDPPPPMPPKRRKQVRVHIVERRIVKPMVEMPGEDWPLVEQAIRRSV